MSVKLENEESVQNIVARLQNAGVDTRSIEGTLMAVLESGDSGLLRRWAREQGEELARSGEQVYSLVERITSVVEALDGALPGAEELSSRLVSDAIEGYIATSKVPTSGAAPSRQMRERLAELTALHRINAAANSSLKL